MKKAVVCGVLFTIVVLAAPEGGGADGSRAEVLGVSRRPDYATVDVRFKLTGEQSEDRMSITVTARLKTTGGPLKVETLEGDGVNGLLSGGEHTLSWLFLKDNPEAKYEDLDIGILPRTNRLILVEGGTFQMGDTFGDGFYVEKPVHDVTLDTFLISRYEITLAEFADVLQWALDNNKAKMKGNEITENFSGQRIRSLYHIREFLRVRDGKVNIVGGQQSRPCVQLNWGAMLAYCNLRSEKEGLTPCYTKGTMKMDMAANGYRLPTEAEWEYAARGGKGGRNTKFSGSDNLDEVAWFRDNAGLKNHIVGTKAPNELGIYDMSGNVWEWCWDMWGFTWGKVLPEEHARVTFYAKSPAENPTGARYYASWNRVQRGGSQFDKSTYCRVSGRSFHEAGHSDDLLGFRVVKRNQ